PHVQLGRPGGPGAHTLAREDVAQLNDLALIADSVFGESADTVWINLGGKHLVLADLENRQGHRNMQDSRGDNQESEVDSSSARRQRSCYSGFLHLTCSLD